MLFVSWLLLVCRFSSELASSQHHHYLLICHHHYQSTLYEHLEIEFQEREDEI